VYICVVVCARNHRTETSADLAATIYCGGGACICIWTYVRVFECMYVFVCVDLCVFAHVCVRAWARVSA
jgi:hypothetical protein